MSVEARPIRFYLNDRLTEVSSVAPTTSVLSFLRQDQRLCGTKEGCAEGDCGACTVVIAEIAGSELQTKAVNACIQFLPTLDGKALYTVEALRQSSGDLHPVQDAMVKCHGSQCGFCTPGFVMSLWALYIDTDGAKTDENRVREAITGNLCRCTGYRPIIKAGRQMFDLPRVVFEREGLKSKLAKINATSGLEYTSRDQRFFAPRSLQELVQLRSDYPDATILAGGTDVGLWVNKQLRELNEIVYTGSVTELRVTEKSAFGISIGAAVSLTDAYAALKSVYPQMNEMWERFASMPIRNAGTLGGNIANGSPIGDSMPALIALGAMAKLASIRGTRRLPLESLYLGYQKKDMAPDEILVSVTIPLPTPELRFRNYKLSKRFDSDISAVCAAFAVKLDGNIVTSCRIAMGGMAATPKRALNAERVLIGRSWDESNVRLGMVALSQDFAPLSDMRATADYRLTAARNLLYRFYLETKPVEPLRSTDVSVFA